MQNLLMDIIFPQQVCCICREPGRYRTRKPWCDKCEENLIIMQDSLPICDKCGKYMDEGEGICAECQKTPPLFDIARAVGPYDEPYRIAIKVLKFMGRRHLAVRMGRMMARVVNEEPRFWPIDLIIPVPASPGHLKQRGFNQTEELGRQISRDIRVKMDAKTLKRVKETPAQRELSREEREKNLLYAFKAEENTKIYRKHLLLVDDVYTTGSTSKECTRTLLDAGAERVCVITWATGVGF
ncbi:MAG TPA: ComF family protein [Gelria sp.]|jgi:competence protein ComFC|nr:ComF family protein [Gelria sp.]